MKLHSYPEEYLHKELEDVITETDILFHIGQSYTEGFARKIVCQRCGAGMFEVGIDDYFTAIRCVNCKWEMCVHEG